MALTGAPSEIINH
jgi:hypothetical protein